MKIALTTDVIYPFTIGGSEMRNYEVGKRLVKMGHEVHIYGAKLWKGKKDIVLDGINIHGISKYNSLYDANGKRKATDPIILSIKTFIRLLEDDYDIIDNLSFVFFDCYATKLASLIKNKPLIYTWQQYFGSYLNSYFGGTSGIMARILEKGSLKLAKNNIAVSEYIKEQLISSGTKQNKINVIYNGADVESAEKIKKQKIKYDIIFVGRLTYQKNPHLVIKSINLLKKKFPKIKACLIGDGEERVEIEKLIKKLNLEKNIEIKGKINDRKEIFRNLKASKIFVLPSRLEGFPLTIIEANACGIPVITTKTEWNNVEEYLNNNGESGIIAKESVEGLSSQIEKLLTNKKLREKMGKNGYEKAKNYDWDKIAEQTVELYSKILRKSK